MDIYTLYILFLFLTRKSHKYEFHKLGIKNTIINTFLMKFCSEIKVIYCRKSKND